MSKYILIIAYDGTNYCGWQVQPNGISIQGLIEKALFVILKEKISVIGSGRTDAGVHALAQVAHFSTSTSCDENKLLRALNGLLPEDIRIREVRRVKEDFHARYSVTSKTYYYFLSLNRYQLPWQYPYSYLVLKKIDLSLLKEAAKKFVGTHDFTSFANRRGSMAKPVKAMKRLDVIEKELIRLEFEADGFLYKMVRNIVGMLLDVASHKKPLNLIDDLFLLKDRRQAAEAAPPHGLFLANVTYRNL